MESATVVEDGQWLDGPGFVEWLGEMGVVPGNESDGRSLRRWRDGGAVSLEVADRLLTECGLGLRGVPDHLWVSSPLVGGFGRHRKLTPKLRREAAERYLSASRGTRVALAGEYGVCIDSVRRWARELQDGDLK